MFDLHHEWGGDLAVGSTGDVALVAGSDVIQQRVYRRLLTNRGDYLWNLDYGGGLAGFVGVTTSPSDIEAVIRNQLGQETAVASNPAPTIGVQMEDNASGYVVADITYTNAPTRLATKLSLSINT